MRKRNFNRLLILALCLVFCFTLTVPAFAAADDLGYQYTFRKEFTFADFTRDDNGWYVVPLDVLSVSNEVDADQVQFSIDSFTYTANFKILQRAYEYHYIGNAAPVLGGGAETSDPFLLVICPDNQSSNKLYLSSEIFGQLFRGDSGKKHIIMSIVPGSPPAPSDLLSVFSIIGNRIISLLNQMVSLFWTVSPNGTGSLTFLGIVSLVSLGLSVVFLLIKVVSRFMHFAG